MTDPRDHCWVCGEAATTTLHVSGTDEPRCDKHQLDHVPACACEDCAYEEEPA